MNDPRRDAVLSKNPTAYWRKDESAGTVLNDEVGNHDGEYINGPTLGVDGAALNTATAVRYDGVDEAGRVANHADLVGFGDFTVELLVRILSWPTDGAINYIIGPYNINNNQRSWAVVLRGPSASNPDTLSLLLSDNGTGATTYPILTRAQVDDEAWHYIAVRRDGTALSVKLDDGDFSSAGTHSVALHASTAPLVMAARPFSSDSSGTANHSNVELDDIALYRHALSDADVDELYDSLFAEPSDPPIIEADLPRATAALRASAPLFSPGAVSIALPRVTLSARARSAGVSAGAVSTTLARALLRARISQPTAQPGAAGITLTRSTLRARAAETAWQGGTTLDLTRATAALRPASPQLIPGAAQAALPRVATRARVTAPVWQTGTTADLTRAAAAFRSASPQLVPGAAQIAAPRAAFSARAGTLAWAPGPVSISLPASWAALSVRDAALVDGSLLMLPPDEHRYHVRPRDTIFAVHARQTIYRRHR